MKNQNINPKMIIKLSCNGMIFICDTMADAFNHVATNKIYNYKISKVRL